MEEIWKDIVGHENKYQVSNLGRVKSLARQTPFKNGKFTRFTKERILKPCLGKRGYYTVGFGKDYPSITIHRIVAFAFLVNSENKICVNHIDGNKLNNNVDNLEWCTYSENNIHGLRTGLITPPWKDKFGKDHHRSRAVNQYSTSGEYMKTFDSVGEATISMGLKSKSLISACASHKKSQLTAAGYKWEYQDNAKHMAGDNFFRK